MLGAQIDRVLRAIKGKGDRLVCLGSVQVVDELYDGAYGRYALPATEPVGVNPSTASRTDIFTAWIGAGYVRIGGDFIVGTWIHASLTGYLTGSVWKVAALHYYPLAAAQAAAHYARRTG